jgi:hypothetical protein
MRCRRGSRIDVAVVCALALATAAGASAQRGETPCAAYWRAPAVFVGRADAIARGPGGRRVTFTVLERFRGAEASAVTLAIDPATSCAAMFRTGREYFVYAERDREGRDLAVRCSRTSDVENGAADLEYARSVAEGRAPAGTISGQVLISTRDLSGRIVKPAQPAADVAVRIARVDGEDRIVTNAAGDFSVAARGAGAYTIAVDVPERYYAESAPATIELREARACGEVELRLAYDGRLSGRIVDAGGRPVAGLTVEVSTSNLAQTRLTTTDREGRYEVAKMPPGRFVVGVASGIHLRAGKPPRVFLPGTSAAGAAARLTLSDGGRVQAPEFRLPASVPYVTIQGFVLDADGTPAEGARVYLKGVGEGDRIVGEPVAVDFVGRFAVAALAGTEYAIFAERTRGSRVDSAEPMRLTPAAGQKPVTLTLRRRY